MPRLVCRLVAREGAGPFPCVVVDPDGWLLRLDTTPQADGVAPVGQVGGVEVWAEQVDDEAVAPDPSAELVIVEDAAPVDEIGVRFGPESHGEGLFDPPESTGTGTGERTGAFSDEAASDQQRTAVLAWISATLGPVGSWPDTAACTPLKRLIADTPPDVLPALDAVPLGGGRAVRPLYAPVLRARADDTATAVDVPTNDSALTDAPSSTTVEAPSIPRWPLVLAAFFAAAAAVAWWWPR
jgi:hypothetical protein